ncbi:hypothetical protein JCM10207_000838 [Rhodosporidiobolus poonsookiae]
MAGSSKRTKAFLKSGSLSKQIEGRNKRRAFEQKKKHRDVRRNKGVLPAHQKGKTQQEESDEEWEQEQRRRREKRDKEMDEEDEDKELDVDGLLGAEGLEDGDDQGEGEDEDANSDLDDDDLSNLSDAESGEGDHMADLRALAEKDPDFFKYLQENDAELLNFDADGDAAMGDSEDDDEEEEDSEEEEEKPKKGKGKEKEVKKQRKANVLTKEILRSWQKSILETRSLRSLRRLLLAFRTAASGSTTGDADDEEEFTGIGKGKDRYEIQSPAVWNKVVVTALKYTPVVLASYVPYKEVGGKYKLATNSKQYAVAQRLIKSYFVSLQALLNSVSRESEIPALAVNESAKLVPWIVGNRKVARGWVKMLLGLYDSSTDEVRVAAFLALRKLAVAADHSLRESILKGAYAAFLASARQTSVYTLPSLTLMKNSASELFLLPGKQETELAYQLAFSYIRQLAILLRKGVKDATKEAYKSVYNWQFVHAVDFWSLVLSSAGDKVRSQEHGESPLKQLLYPLIQVALGAIRLVPTSRYFPLRFHLLRSLLRIVQRTGTFIPLSPALFSILDAPELTKRSKPSTLKPLDWDLHLKCPTSYQRTRVYADALVDELIALASDYYAALSTSIAFPELALPAIVALRRAAKRFTSTGQPRTATQLKQLVERLEASSRWIDERREKVEFAPAKRDKVDRFLSGEQTEKTPMGTHAKLVRKLREGKKAQLARAVVQSEDI